MCQRAKCFDLEAGAGWRRSNCSPPEVGLAEPQQDSKDNLYLPALSPVRVVSGIGE